MNKKIETVDELKDILWSMVLDHDDVCECDYCIANEVVGKLTYPY